MDDHSWSRASDRRWAFVNPAVAGNVPWSRSYAADLDCGDHSSQSSSRN
jgi:hypothetical protein